MEVGVVVRGVIPFEVDYDFIGPMRVQIIVVIVDGGAGGVLSGTVTVSELAIEAII